MKLMKKYLVLVIKKEDGWTFMETLIVIAVILLLTATVGFTAVGSLEKARIAAAKTQIESLSTALEAYYIDCGKYPDSEQGLRALRIKPDTGTGTDNWNGPYIYKNVPNDPWGEEYEYLVPDPEGNPYGIRSFGADGIEGGEGKNADITSWN